MKWSLTTIILSIIAGLIVLWVMQEAILSSYISRTLGMKASVLTARITPTHLKIGHFKIDNPWKYQSSHAFTADSIEVFYQWKDLSGNPSVIRRIEVDQINLEIEFDPGTKNFHTNWNSLLEKVPERKKDHREVIVQELVLTNINVQIRGFRGKDLTKFIERMEFSNISSQEGFPTEELVREIFGEANLMEYIRGMIPKVPSNGVLKKILPF